KAGKGFLVHAGLDPGAGNQARFDAVDGDIVPRQVQGGAADQGLQAGLGDTVGGAARNNGLGPADGGDKNQSAAVGGLGQVGGRGADQPEGSLDHAADAELDGLFRHAEHSAVGNVGGGVNDDVQAPVAVHGVRHQFFDTGLVVDVDLENGGLAAAGGDGGQGLVGIGKGAGGNNHG